MGSKKYRGKNEKPTVCFPKMNWTVSQCVVCQWLNTCNDLWRH